MNSDCLERIILLGLKKLATAESQEKRSMLRTCGSGGSEAIFDIHV